jgi:hypothetical protein
LIENLARLDGIGRAATRHTPNAIAEGVQNVSAILS